MPGVYALICKPNGRAYVGSAKVLNTRRKTHLLQLSENRHYNQALQKDWNTYGAKHFEFKVLERVECWPWMQPIRLVQAEQRHIEAQANLYNERAANKKSRRWWHYLLKWL